MKPSGPGALPGLVEPSASSSSSGVIGASSSFLLSGDKVICNHLPGFGSLSGPVSYKGSRKNPEML